MSMVDFVALGLAADVAALARGSKVVCKIFLWEPGSADRLMGVDAALSIPSALSTIQRQYSCSFPQESGLERIG